MEPASAPVSATVHGRMIGLLLALQACGGSGISAPSSRTQVVEVVVATVDVAPGVTLTKEHVDLRRMPVALLPEKQSFLALEHVVGRIPRTPLFAGEIVSARRLADPESGAGLDAVIPLGTHIVQYRVDDALPIRMGSYVDLLWDPGDGYCAVQQAAFVIGPMPDRHGYGAAHDRSHSVLLEENGLAGKLDALYDPSFRRVLRNDLDIAIAEEIACR